MFTPHGPTEARMKSWSQLFWATFLALATALLWGVAPAVAAAPASRTISNVATIEWNAGATRLSLASNRVDILVSAPITSILETFRVGGGLDPALLGATCSAGVALRSAAAGGGVVSFGEIELIRGSKINAGEPLALSVERLAANRDPNAAETIQIVVRTQDGDEERLSLYESGLNTGVFLGVIATTAAPAPPGSSGDCRLSVRPGGELVFDAKDAADLPAFGSATFDILVDPFGIAFDSADGVPVSGVKITIVDAATGQPAPVFGDDGVSAYPSSVVTGQNVTDSGGTVYAFPPGDYRFPLMRPGQYRLIVEPPPPYLAPSQAPAAGLALLRRPDGAPFAIVAGSFGGLITLSDPSPVRIDIPLDKISAAIQLAKTASRPDAEPGDLIQYRITIRNPDSVIDTGIVTVSDRIPAGTRLRAGTTRLNGVQADDPIISTNKVLTFQIPAVSPGATSVLSYVLEIRPDARSGDALNRAQAAGTRNNASNVADALVRIRRESIADRMTIIGRVVDGACSVDPAARPGIAGVRIMLEDGSYAVTDAEGNYHFEGVKPGTHVVQLDDMTLPADRAAVDCARNTRSGGRAFSRFVDGQGGALKRVDFHAAEVAPRADARAAAAIRPTAASDADAAGAERDWTAGQAPGIEWLFPEVEHNPRAPVVRVAIKHLPGQSVKLFVDGRPVDPIASDGLRKNGDGNVAVSLWRGIPLEKRVTQLGAEIRGADGALIETLRRPVFYSNSPIRAEYLRDKSTLIADGVTRPVIALRLTDRDGRPVHHGLVGDFEVPAPYYPAVEADAQQARQLAGLERARPVWRVDGEDGVAYVTLEPTTASGTVSLRFNFRDGETAHQQRVEAWLEPGARAWTIVGLAEGTLGYNRLDKAMELLGPERTSWLTDGRLALYAKGRVAGKWLMTLSYDSDKKEDESRFGGIIDPQAYYTIYADRSERRYDAASVRRLYLKLERPQFYALFGDYDTGIDEPELARYVRAFNGVKAEYRSGQVAATAFAADTPNRHRRDELQGNGLTGPYKLSARNILANSERITIEVRDRLRSERIADSKLLTRHIDYDIDYATGVLRFREPILSRSSGLDPQFIVADYEVDGIAERVLNAGGRVAWKSADQKLQVGATLIHDEDIGGKTTLGGADLRYRPSATTEIRAEVAISDADPAAGSTAGTGGTATAWQVEAEHHGSKYDVLAYAREQEGGFGVGQLNRSENGTRKIGVDGRARIGEDWSLSGSAWHEEYLTGDARRVAGRALIEYRGRDFSARAGVTIADDRLADGREATSNIVQLGATRRLFDNKLELDAQTEIPVGGKDESIDFPARHRFGARYAIHKDISLIGAYEIADGETIDARTARIGFDLKPWAGARISLTGNMQDIAEYGPRSFAAYGMSQSLVLDKNWSIDFSLDGNKTLGGIDPTRVLNPLHPVSSGGFVADGSSLTEDFTAITAGATYRAKDWSITGRAEYRAGDADDRYGLTIAALRQLGEGKAVGAAFNWFTARAAGGAETRTINLQASWAHRPSDSRFAFLDKLELREDRVTGAVAGVPSPIGTPLTVTGDARTRRVVNALSINYSPHSGDGEWLDRTEVSLFWGSRYVSDKYGAEDIRGWSNLVGADIRFDLNDMVDVGATATVRQGVGGDSFSYSAGPSVGIKPFDNGWLSVGWNLVGFHDRDFSADRYTRDGPYVTMRLKFDQSSLQGLGLGRR